MSKRFPISRNDIDKWVFILVLKLSDNGYDREYIELWKKIWFQQIALWNIDKTYLHFSRTKPLKAQASSYLSGPKTFLRLLNTELYKKYNDFY